MFVIVNRFVSYEYFMDEMEDYEIQTLSEYVQWANYNEWQQTRLLFYAMLKPYMKNDMTPAKLLPLATDDEEHDIEVTNQQVDMLKKRAEIIQKKLFK